MADVVTSETGPGAGPDRPHQPGSGLRFPVHGVLDTGSLLANALGMLLLLTTASLHAQLIPRQGPPPTSSGTGGYRLIPLPRQPEITPGALRLIELESRFQEAVALGGGKAFGTFFAEDAVVLSNGQPAVLGRGAIAAQAQWDPKTYQLTWVVEGAQMSESADMGFTWGHYDSTLTPATGAATTTSGRYFTVWRRLKDGTWKVALDASSNEPGVELPVPPAVSVPPKIPTAPAAVPPP